MPEAPAAVAVDGGILLTPCGPVGQCDSILGFPGGGVQYIHAVGGSGPRGHVFDVQLRPAV